MQRDCQRSALVVGSDSVIAKSLINKLQSEGFKTFATSRRNASIDSLFLDLLRPEHFEFKESVDVVYICAAMVSLAQCRDNAELSERINFEAPVVLAKKLLPLCKSLVFLSTSAVFDGKKPQRKETEQTCPITKYGEDKARAEAELLALSDKVSVVRLSKVLTPEYTLFMDWFSKLQLGESIEPFYDLNLCPISLPRVVDCLLQIACKHLSGVIHLSGYEDVSYVDVAHYLVDKLDLPKSRVEAKSAFDCGIDKTAAPEFSSLDMSSSNLKFGLAFEHWSSLLDQLYLRL